MLKDYLKKQNISMYALAKDSGVAYSTINDIANGRVDIENCKLGAVRAIAKALDISIDELCAVTAPAYHAFSEEYKTDVNISVSNKNYYADFKFRDQIHRIRLCPVNTINTEMINDIAEYAADDVIENCLLEEIEIK